jgi:hypothetical protein
MTHDDFGNLDYSGFGPSPRRPQPHHPPLLDDMIIEPNGQIPPWQESSIDIGHLDCMTIGDGFRRVGDGLRSSGDAERNDLARRQREFKAFIDGEGRRIGLTSSEIHITVDCDMSDFLDQLKEANRGLVSAQRRIEWQHSAMRHERARVTLHWAIAGLCTLLIAGTAWFIAYAVGAL